ncbi:MAG: hypothetical protein DYH01_08855 [Chlorobi bacterium CHB7]|nr:hypothetical protein [Chlorobi bacterium CHB7]
MSLTKFKKHILIVFLLTFSVSLSCNNSSETSHKDKLIFLYRLNTNVSILREETFTIQNQFQA